MNNDYISRADALAVAQYSKDPVDGIQNLPGVFGWIPVTERLPEMKTDVLVYFQIGKNMAVGFLCDMDEDKTMWCAYTDDGWYTDCDFEPTHWMPLPAPPEEEANG